MRRRPALALAAAVLALPVVLFPAGTAAAVPADKPLVLGSWTGTSSGSYRSWWSARQHRAAWHAYGFDWSTDYCSHAPDRPLGFPFRKSCARHDFGYRNYKAAGTFAANKTRLDSAFHADMKRVCAGYVRARRSSCRATARLYYEAVRAFGHTPLIDGGARSTP
ncbi:phospholipase [Streptomyces sp. NPDC059176]|uniref:phospholipase n=1 Tax=unclassified Streptomyces TaxID=2593676 RepID=UPI0036B0C631